MKCFGSLENFYFWFCCLLLFVRQNFLPTLFNLKVTVKGNLRSLLV